MRLIIDTNRIIAALIKDSISRKIITHLNAELFAISFSKNEVSKYKTLILEKSNLKEIEYELIFDNINSHLVYLDDKIINLKINEASILMDKIDPDDAPFLVAALATNSELWSDDKHFEKQDKIKVWKTKDLVKFL